MDNILPLDVFTRIIDHVNHESLLASRLTCRNIKELVSPLLFASIRIVCTAESLQRLDEFAEKNLELSRLVLDLTVDCIPQVKGEDALVNLLMSHFERDYHIQFPNLCSMVVRFPETNSDSMINSVGQSWQQISVLRYLLPTFMRLRQLKIIRAPVLFKDKFSREHLASISSFTMTKRCQLTKSHNVPVPSAFSTTFGSTLQALSPEKLTALRLGASDTTSKTPLIPIDVHFPNLTTLSVEGFELDAENVAPTHTDFAGFIIRHRASLDRLALVDCVLVYSHMHLDVGERVQAWVEKVGLSSVVHYQCEPL